MTSNVGSTAISELAGTDPERARKEAMEALRESFRPEFLNRIDEIVIFNPLGKEQLAKIVGLLMKDVERRSEEHTSELQSRLHLVCRLLLEKKKLINAVCFSRSKGLI